MDGINWGGLVSQRNPFGNFIEGAQAGQQMRKSRMEAEQEAQRRQAYNLFATDPKGAEAALLAQGDIEGAEAMRKRNEERASKFNRGMVGVVAQTKGPSAARDKAVQIGETDLADQYAKLDESQRKAAVERAGILAAYVESLEGDPAQVKAQIMADADALMELGFTREQIEAFEPTPAALARLRAEALGLKGVLEQKDREEDNARAAEKAKADEEYRKQQLGLQRQRVGISADANRRGWAAFNERKRAGGFGTPGVGGVAIADDDVEIDP